MAAFGTPDSPLHGKTELYQSAQCVQLRGNKAVHVDPDITQDALDTIRKAVRVIDALSKV